MIDTLASTVPGLGWSDPGLNSWNSPVGVAGLGYMGRYLGSLGAGSREATDAEKNQASRLADAGDKAGVTALLAQLAPWAASWRPVSMGGWYSYTDVVERASTTFAERHPTYAAVSEANRRLNPLAEGFSAGETLETATTYWDPNAAARRTACEATGGNWLAEKQACESAFTIPTWAKILGALALGGYALNAARPYLGSFGSFGKRS